MSRKFQLCFSIYLIDHLYGFWNCYKRGGLPGIGTCGASGEGDIGVDGRQRER